MADQSGIQGAFLPTTDVYDVDVIRSLQIGTPEFYEFLVRLRQSTNNIAVAVNFRDAGYYVQQLFNCGQVFFPNPALNSSTPQTPSYRSVFRMVVNFGALPNTGLKSVAHNIPNLDANCVFRRIYGTATNTAAFIGFPIPNSFVATGNIVDISVDATNVNIITGSNRSNFNITYVIVEYLTS